MTLQSRSGHGHLRLLPILAAGMLLTGGCEGQLSDLIGSTMGDETPAEPGAAAPDPTTEAPDDPSLPAMPGGPTANGPTMPEPPHEPGMPHEPSELPVGHPGFSDARIRPAGSASYDQVKPGEVAPTGLASGNFRVPCKFSHMNYDDPILYPGDPGAAHLHTYFGNVEADASSTAESLATTGASTCSGGILDRSAYWVPALLDAEGKPVAPSDEPHFNMFYYKSGWSGVPAAETQTIPPGLQMIAGNAGATAAQDLDVVGWSCTDENEVKSEPSPTMPDCRDGEELTLQVFFPDCWDGVGTEWDGGAHVTYSASGGCPEGWIGIPQITTNVHWDVTNAASGGYRLSSDPVGAAPGLTAHADFFDAWDQDVADTFVEHCIRAGKDCQSNLLGDGRRLYWD